PTPVTPKNTTPSLLRYVDHDLVLDTSRHNVPPDPFISTCCICHDLWYRCPKSSTYLPLTPCGCWVHYRCFIGRACQPWWHSESTQCPGCGFNLFIWEGITALTLLTRTGLPIPDYDSVRPHQPTQPHHIQLTAPSAPIQVAFFAQLSRPSHFPDGSPDLVAAIEDVLAAVRAAKRPRSVWLNFATRAGELCWGVLICAKVRRYVLEEHGLLRGTFA
ncbi:hypothetical protein DM02DRAFT_490284, partial [Periconia macrospinosa]